MTLEPSPTWLPRQKVSPCLARRARQFCLGLWGLAALAMVDRVTAADQAQLDSAIEAYQSALDETDRNRRIVRFQRAEQLFRQVAEGQPPQPPIENADLYFNIGNAALQAERIGPAIVAYRKALHLKPDHAKARQNLNYARSLVPEWIRGDRHSGLADSLFFWTNSFSPGGISLTAACSFAVATLLFVLGVMRSNSLIRNAALLPLFVWIVLVASRVSIQLNRDVNNLVVTSEAVLHSADSENSPPRISRPLPSGAEIQLIDQRGRWSEVKIAGGSTGWILNSTAERVD